MTELTSVGEAARANPLRPVTPAVSERIHAVPREQWTDATREVFAVFEGEEGRALGSKFNVVHMCAHHPALATAFFGFNRNLLVAPIIPGRLREIVVLRVAWRNRCIYEWVQHIEIRRRDFGLPPEYVEAVKEGVDHPIWSDLERLALRAVDQLAQTSILDEATWNGLAAHFGPAEMLELLFLVGNYTMLAWVLNATGVKLEPGMPHANPFD